MELIGLYSTMGSNYLHLTRVQLVILLWYLSSNVCAIDRECCNVAALDFSTSSKTLNLIDILDKIADNSVKATGFFHSGPELHCIQLHPHPE